jgi:hypothetical protein
MRLFFFLTFLKRFFIVLVAYVSPLFIYYTGILYASEDVNPPRVINYQHQDGFRPLMICHLDPTKPQLLPRLQVTDYHAQYDNGFKSAPRMKQDGSYSSLGDKNVIVAYIKSQEEQIYHVGNETWRLPAGSPLKVLFFLVRPTVKDHTGTIPLPSGYYFPQVVDEEGDPRCITTTVQKMLLQKAKRRGIQDVSERTPQKTLITALDQKQREQWEKIRTVARSKGVHLPIVNSRKQARAYLKTKGASDSDFAD